MTALDGSSSQYCRKSLPERSALLPIEMKLERPSPSRLACSMMARPRAPLWEKKPTLPRVGAVGEKVAFMRTEGSRLITPMQFGPTNRMPACRHAVGRTELHGCDQPRALGAHERDLLADRADPRQGRFLLPERRPCLLYTS